MRLLFARFSLYGRFYEGVPMLHDEFQKLILSVHIYYITGLNEGAKSLSQSIGERPLIA